MDFRSAKLHLRAKLLFPAVRPGANASSPARRGQHLVCSVCVSARAALADKANRLPSSLGLKLQIPVRLKGTSLLKWS